MGRCEPRTQVRWATSSMITKRNVLAVTLPLLVTLSCCGGWKTRYSGKDDESNAILINLDKEGRLTFGPCGPGRKILEGYMFDLRPIRPIYTDDEINLMRKGERLEPIKPVKGTVSFNQDYSRVTININLFRDGRLEPFLGNGTYRVNGDD